MYKMAVLDIDGTILNSKRKISKGTKEAITELTDRGIPVCLCTGRNIYKTLPIAKKLNIKTPFMCIDGMVMYDPVENKIIRNNILPREDMLSVLSIVKDAFVYLEIINGFKYYRYVKDKELESYVLGGSSFSNNLYRQLFWKIKRVKNLDFFYEQDIDLYQLIVGGAPDQLEIITKKIKALNNPAIDIEKSLWKNYLFINAKNVRKSDGVKLLCNHYNIDMSEVVAIGDELNDLDMLKAVGMGVAMGNGLDAVKNVAGFITDTNDKGGVALALNKFFGLK